MKARLIKTDFGYKLNDLDGVYIASEATGKLSLKNCQAIERGYDLDELCENYAANPMSNFAKYGDEYVAKNSFGRGFLKALEIIGDRKFTEEDMRKALHRLATSFMRGYSFDKDIDFQEGDGIIQSLQQNEWEVEVEMEEVAIGDKYTPEPKPKLDEENCLILKRL